MLESGGTRNLLVKLVRAGTRFSTEHDQQFAVHVSSCQNKDSCTIVNCNEAKIKYQHFVECVEPKCFSCISARFVAANCKGAISANLEERFLQAFSNLLSMGIQVKKSTEDFEEARKNGTISQISEARRELTLLKSKQNSLKCAFLIVSLEVYLAWDSIAHERRTLVPPITTMKTNVDKIPLSANIKRLSREWESLSEDSRSIKGQRVEVGEQ